MAASRRFLLWLCLAVCFLSPFVINASAADLDLEDEPSGLVFTHVFPNNPFKLITAGESTKLDITVTNTGDAKHIVSQVSGIIVNPTNTTAIYRNLTTLYYKTAVAPGENVTVPFKFVVEAEPGPYGMVVFVDVLDEENKPHREVAFQDLIQLVENDSLFDLQSISLYLLLTAGFGGVLYFVYQSFFGGKTTGRAKRVKPVAAPVQNDVTPGEPDMEWIPEHLIKQQAAAKKRSVRVKRNTPKEK
ncbi:hypothetical protein HDU85_006192 [Gaertneriomyces sp. JEL0708]|nr:hypothetical protein HDU85_006192 [Gaertneriomyces sp. JEL0708]